MSDTSTPEPVVPAKTTPAEPVALNEPASEPDRVVETDRATEPDRVVETDRATEPDRVVETDRVAEPAPVVATEPAGESEPVEKKRGLGISSFVIGVLTLVSDLAFVIFGIFFLVGASLTSLTSEDLAVTVAALGGAGLAFFALFLFFGGFLSGGVAALLGLIALISGRGRVLGFLGLLFGVGAIAVRLLLLSSGEFTPTIG